jgi:hypothetical protein
LPIETAAYISDLNAANPPDADPVGQADDHIRLIKGVLKATFPNLTGAVTATQGTLNAGIPPGIISFWYGSTGSIPSGWALCTGATVARSDGTGPITTPNLTDTFIRCATGAGAVVPGATGGTSSHSHGVTVAGHNLSLAELPSHNHIVTDPGHSHGVSDPGHSHSYTKTNLGTVLTGTIGVNLPHDVSSDSTSTSTTGISVSSATTGISTQNAGSGGSHAHPGSTSDSQAHLPPFTGLVAIMKI